MKLVSSPITKVSVVLETDSEVITLEGKADVVTENKIDYEQIYSDEIYYPKLIQRATNITTTLNWIPNENGVSCKYTKKEKKPVKKEKHDIVTVSFYDLEDEVFEAQNKDTLHVVVKDGILNINAKDNYGNTRLFGAVKDWLSFKHERI